jgi:hypothetical protein
MHPLALAARNVPFARPCNLTAMLCDLRGQFPWTDGSGRNNRSATSPPCIRLRRPKPTTIDDILFAATFTRGVFDLDAVCEAATRSPRQIFCCVRHFAVNFWLKIPRREMLQKHLMDEQVAAADFAVEDAVRSVVEETDIIPRS